MGMSRNDARHRAAIITAVAMSGTVIIPMLRIVAVRVTVGITKIMDSKMENANCQAHVQLLELGRHGLALERWAVGGSWLRARELFGQVSWVVFAAVGIYSLIPYPIYTLW